ncbi:MAG: hypothetical protein IT291_06600 [Deltaproteobacteria bacterium]|nr:hypothetical protein [Deltaproteobacteria bacterium]
MIAKTLTKLISIAISAQLLLASGCATYEFSRSLSPNQEAMLNRKLISIMNQVTRHLDSDSTSAFDSARALLSLAESLSPDDPRVADGFGCLAWRENDFDLAEEYFKKAVSLDSNYDRGYAHLALVAMQNGDREAAKKLFEIALYLNPLNYRARNNFAGLLIEGGETKEAYEELLKAQGSGATDEWEIQNNLHLTTTTAKETHVNELSKD